MCRDPFGGHPSASRHRMKDSGRRYAHQEGPLRPGRGKAVVVRSVGVEEELLLVDAETGEPRALSAAVLAAASREAAGKYKNKVFEAELQREQLEFATRPQVVMGDLADEIRRWRAE